jgi:hypothetical protein
MARLLLPSFCPKASATNHILIMINIGTLRHKLLGQFNFSAYRSNINPTLHDIQIDFYQGMVFQSGIWADS